MAVPGQIGKWIAPKFAPAYFRASFSGYSVIIDHRSEVEALAGPAAVITIP